MSEPGAFAKVFKRDIFVDNIDNTISCRCDFYKFANGKWLDNNPIPDEYSAWGSFLQLRDLNLERCRDLLTATDESASSALTTDESASAHLGALKNLAQGFYKAGMDEERANASDPNVVLAPYYDMIDNLSTNHTPATITKVIAEFHVSSVAGVLFYFASDVDNKDSNWTIGQIGQGGLGLPDKDYYTDADKEEKRTAYKAHVAKMLLHLKHYPTPADAEAAADAIFNFEKHLADSHMTKTEKRDPEKTYNPMSLDQVKEKFPGLDFDVYFSTLFPDDFAVGKINICQLDALTRVGDVVTAASDEPADLIHYMRWKLLNNNADYLTEELVEEDFDFFGRQLSGQKVLKQRWKRVMGSVESHLGEALGQLYVDKWFSGEAKPKALRIVESVRDALKERLAEVTWMKASTRENAMKKMRGFRVQIGFQDEWPDFGTFGDCDGLSYVECVNLGRKFQKRRDLDRVNRATDKNRWYMSPQTVNAYYHPNYNLICFPAAILQPPFYDPEADDAVNYGAMGAVVGHEMTHGFDDQGAKFDADGNMVDWWTEEDSKDFEARVEKVIEQAEEHVVHGVNLKGKLTAGENLADLGGLKLSLRAFKKTLTGKEELIDGFTPVQRFFLSWASCWRQNVTEERAKQLVTLDPHGPSELRCNGPLSNMPEFHEAFDIKEDDPMYRPVEKRVDVW